MFVRSLIDNIYSAFQTHLSRFSAIFLWYILYVIGLYRPLFGERRKIWLRLNENFYMYILLICFGRVMCVYKTNGRILHLINLYINIHMASIVLWWQYISDAITLRAMFIQRLMFYFVFWKVNTVFKSSLSFFFFLCWM